ncbi:unnamed protein product [Cylicocyclus nassatus]|uniref:Secreted protein n=1 Tax=Cylicocyclus nassatus TaxID=53992 RepID=A0AA36HEN6_CYLNA|nr:unnamed protein product [Cylicocyclus nassatus]
MVPSIFVVLLASSIVTLAVAAPPKVVLEENPLVFGTIQGSPIIAVIHGQSDPVKEDVQAKDSENDPLEKMLSLMA